MVGPAALLVIADDEGSRVVKRAVNNGFDDIALKPSTIDRHIGRMLALLRATDDPADLGESAIGASVIKCIKAWKRNTFIAKGAARWSVLVLLEVGKHVVLKVIEILPNTPRDACVLEILWGSLPGEREAVVTWRIASRTGTIGEDVAATTIRIGGGALGVDGTTHPSDAIGVSDAEDALVRVVHDGPALGNVKVGRNILAFEVAHVVVGIRSDPTITAAIIPGAVHGVPAVGAACHTLGGVLPITTKVIDVPGRKCAYTILVTFDGSNCMLDQREQRRRPPPCN